MMKKLLLLALCSSLLLEAAPAPEKPSYLGNQYGMEGLSPDFIEPGSGLKPLKLFGRTIVQDFKRISLSAENLLPENAVVLDQPVLAKPARLVFADKQGTPSIKFAPAQIRMSGKNAIAGTASGEADQFKFQGKMTVDFDGTIFYELTLTPKGQATLTRFALEFPVNLPDDQLCYANVEPPNRLMSGLEAERRRLSLNLKDKKIVKPGFCNDFWVGNTKYGMSLYFESPHGWHTTAGNEHIFDPNTNLLTVNLIDHETTLSQPVTYRFFYNLTPVRRLPKDWRSWRYGTRYNNKNKTDNTHLIYWQFWRANQSECHNNLWQHNPQQVKEIADFDKAAGKSILHYINPIMFSHTVVTQHNGKTLVLEDPYLRDLCAKHHILPQSTYLSKMPPIPTDAQRFTNAQERDKAQDNAYLNGKVVTEYAPPIPEIRDQFIASVKAMMDLGCDGIYCDCCVPTVDFRPGIQGGMPDDTNKLRPYWYIVQFRQMFKRIRAMVRQNNPNALMMAHAAGAPVISLFDMRLIGENDYYWYKEPDLRDLSQDGSYYYAYIWGDIDNLKVNYARAWGIPIVILPELRGRDSKVFKESAKGTRTMLAYTIQFDYSYWPLWCNVREIEKFNAIRLRFGMKDDSESIIDFTPYWENKIFSSSDPNVKLGYYERIQQFDPDTANKIPRWKKYLLLASNIQFTKSTFTIALPENITNMKVIDRQTNKPVPVVDGKVTLTLEPYDFAVLQIDGTPN